jgi:hypothetical protein
MSPSAVSARQGRDAPVRLGATPADAAPQGRRPSFLSATGLTGASTRRPSGRHVRPFASYLPPEAIVALFRAHRALISSTLALYEWRPEGQKVKQPFVIARQDGKPMDSRGSGKAGEERAVVIRSFAVITTGADYQCPK